MESSMATPKRFNGSRSDFAVCSAKGNFMLEFVGILESSAILSLRRVSQVQHNKRYVVVLTAARVPRPLREFIEKRGRELFGGEIPVSFQELLETPFAVLFLRAIHGLKGAVSVEQYAIPASERHLRRGVRSFRNHAEDRAILFDPPNGRIGMRGEHDGRMSSACVV